MIRPIHPWLLAAGLLGASAGCNYSDPTPMVPSGSAAGDFIANSGAAVAGPSGPAPSPGAEGDVQHDAIFESAINLIQHASENPGGEHFKIAIDHLNHYFADTPSSEYVLDPKARAYLLEQLPEEALRGLESPRWSLTDTRHIEDCMLYHAVATRVAGTGDDLARARRVFDWVIRQIMLVPPESLGRAYARPFDVLLRGMAVESEGFWAERGWLFMSLCRQLNIDVGIITYTPASAKEKIPVGWVCGALIGGKIYLFDARIGLEVPGPDGAGVATLDEAIRDPAVLGRLDLPGQSPYGTTAELLASSPSKVGIWLDSSPGYLSPRMLLLQRSLVGKNRTVLHRDPADQRDKFVAALGPNAGKVVLWELPVLVQTLLFTNPQFVQALQQSLFIFQSKFPLVYARMKQLKGDTKGAIQDYVALRFAEQPVEMDRETPIPAEIQQALDVYATYFLALCQLDRGDPAKALPFFERTLGLLPEPGPNRPYFAMLRWGAEANLGRLEEERGDPSRALAYYTLPNLTYQFHGNLLRARELVWQDPIGLVPAALPPAPGSDAKP